jgi:hypothetical protein
VTSCQAASADGKPTGKEEAGLNCAELEAGLNCAELEAGLNCAELLKSKGKASVVGAV